MTDSGGTRRLSAFVVVIALITSASISLGSVVLFRMLTRSNDRRAQQVLINRNTQTIIHQQQEALRSVLCLAEVTVLHDKSLSVSQVQQAVNFYTKALFLIHASPCSTSS